MLNFCNRVLNSQRPRFGWLCVALLMSAACAPDPRPAPSAARHLVGGTLPGSPVTPMVALSLESQSAFDDFEARLLRRMSVPELIAVYRTLAAGMETVTEARDALLLQRLAMLHLRLGTREGGFQEAFSIADRLRKDMPNSPHTEFLIGAITALLMPAAADGSYSVPPRRVDVARRLVEHWGRLLKAAPDYVGPNGRGAAQVRRDRDTLKAALSQMDATPVAEPKVDSEEGTLAAKQGVAAERATDTEAQAAASQEAVKEASNADVAAAQQALHSLDGGDTMARRVLCRDRTERPLDPKEPTSDIARLVELRCALDLDDPTRARAWLIALLDSGGVQEPCRWVRAIGGGDVASERALNDALARAGHVNCISQ